MSYLHPAISSVPIAAIDWGTQGFSYAIEQAHLPGLIVSGILLALSVISWSIMFNKMVMTNKAARQNYKFVHGFRNSKSALEPYLRKVNIPGSPLMVVYRSACRELSQQLIGSGEVDESTHARFANAGALNPRQMETVQLAMERATGEMVLYLERRMNFLATAVSGAPFLGLLGTVWGVMEVFSRVASTGASASIKLMAPGVSAALVTTVIALLVAIPAMFGYNMLINKIRTLILEMHNFSAELGAILERQFVDYHPRPTQVVAPVAPAGHAPPVQPYPYQEPQPYPQPQTYPAPPPSHSTPADDSFGPSNQEPPINPIAQQAARRLPRRPV